VTTKKGTLPFFFQLFAVIKSGQDESQIPGRPAEHIKFVLLLLPMVAAIVGGLFRQRIVNVMALGVVDSIQFRNGWLATSKNPFRSRDLDTTFPTDFAFRLSSKE
jgi:hypothetical protein